MHLHPLLTLIPSLLPLTQAQSPSPSLSNYGYWILRLYETWAPSGIYSKTTTHCQYFTSEGTLGEVVYCADEYIPDSRGHVHTPCNDSSFSCKLLVTYDSGQYLYEIKQTVTLGAEKVALVGQKNITKTRSGAGTTFESLDRIDAMLADAKATPI